MSKVCPAIGIDVPKKNVNRSKGRLRIRNKSVLKKAKSPQNLYVKISQIWRIFRMFKRK